MLWKNLKVNKCPQCSKLLDFKDGLIFCKCGFKIGPNKMREVIGRLEETGKPYDDSPCRVLCSICGNEFDGQAWMMDTTKPVTCNNCYHDLNEF